jgi:hypothetical protein
MVDPKHYAFEHFLYFDEDGCLHIKDQNLINQINEYWKTTSDVCIKLDGGGGGAPTDSMCKCRKPR